MQRVALCVIGYRAIKYLTNGVFDSIYAAAKKITTMDTRIVYIDNYSRDGSVEYLYQKYKNIDILMSPKNYMYCEGMNTCIRFAYKKYNPDYYILVDADNPADIDAYLNLINFSLKNPNVGMVQPLVRSLDDERLIYSCGHRFLEDGQCRPLTSIPENKEELLNLKSCSISSTLFRKEIFLKVGLLDPIYEMYFESSDISFKVNKLGYHCACNTNAITYNEGTEAQGINNFHNRYYFHRNRLIFWKLHDKEMYETVVNILKPKYEELQSRYLNSEYGLNHYDEAIRKGIEEGLNLTSNDYLFTRDMERIDNYDKNKAVLVNNGI